MKGKPSEENCRDCEWFRLWSGTYGGPAGFPACCHPSLRRLSLIPDELDSCPEE